MKLFILRHGIAVDQGTPGYEKDRDRILTEEGIEEMKLIAKAMKILDLKFDVILSSPFVRARQTAEIVAKELELEKKLEFSTLLQCGGNAEKFIQDLQAAQFGPRHSVLIVGHEPYLSGLMSVLLTGESDMAVDVKKAGFSKLSIDKLRYGRCAVLKWLMTPKQMVRISQS